MVKLYILIFILNDILANYECLNHVLTARFQATLLAPSAVYFLLMYYSDIHLSGLQLFVH